MPANGLHEDSTAQHGLREWGQAKLLRESGIDDSHMDEYELDHIIPLAVGGQRLLLERPWL